MERAQRFAIVELTGGLGNQLFQYAAARALALREARRLHFAWHLHRGDTQRRFMLSAFSLPVGVDREPLTRMRLRLLGLRSPLPLVDRKPGPTWQRMTCRLAHLKERGFAHAPLASDAQGVVLQGYFQSWRYFADAQPEIRSELQVAQPPSGPNAVLLRRMATENAVCLHIRRGDYVSNPAAAAFHGSMQLDYYRAAIAALGACGRDATFYVFSDDPAWARAHLQTGRPTVVVAHNGVDAPWEDLRLMAACRHFVIANSSLSWWGAWLSEHPQKRVVAPARWFADSTIDTRDLCPGTWLRL